jgi:hypothetical protein
VQARSLEAADPPFDGMTDFETIACKVMGVVLFLLLVVLWVQL